MGKQIKMKISDGAEIGVYHAPAIKERRGGLVLIQEIFGVNHHIRDVADRYAALGFEVLAPSLFDREAPGFESDYAPEKFREALWLAREEHPFELSIADAQRCIDALKDKGPVFMVGYCYGGSVTWASACKCENLAAASGYYGSYIVNKLKDLQPRVPVILHFGKTDEGIPMADVDAFKTLHPDVPVYVYDAGHAFNSDRPAYHEPSAKLALERTLEWFGKFGG